MSSGVSGILSPFLLNIKARRVLFAVNGKLQKQRKEDKHLEEGLRDQEKLRMSFSDITFESRLFC